MTFPLVRDNIHGNHYPYRTIARWLCERRNLTPHHAWERRERGGCLGAGGLRTRSRLIRHVLYAEETKLQYFV